MKRHGVEQTIARDVEIGENEVVVWAPFPGFQEKALAASEFELFIGGAKGPGKSDLILVKPLAQVHLLDFKALILRETFPEAEELMARARKLYGQVGGKWQAKDRQFQWYGNAAISGPAYTGHGHLGLIRFGYCERLEDVERYQGHEWANVNVDEMANLSNEAIVEDLIKEIRCPNPDVMLQFMGSGNPGFAGQAWVKRRFIDKCGKHGEKVFTYEIEIPVFDGSRQTGTKVVTRHRRFIPGRVQDNPIYANDERYMATLLNLPDERRKQMFYGDWDAGLASALGEVDEAVHIVPRFEVPPHWERWGCLDWGFQHRWVFGGYAASPEGRAYKLDTLTGQREYPPSIASKILGRFPDAKDWLLLASADLFSKRPAQGLDVPPRSEEFMEAGLVFTQADASPGSRVSSLNNLRDWLKWKKQGVGGADKVPGLLFVDTPGNRWCVSQLQDMVTDPKRPEDVLKVDVNPQTGEGGDDAYDETRMAMTSRPYTPPDDDATPAHHLRVHGRARKILEDIYRKSQESEEVAAAGEYEDAPALGEADADAWGDAMR